MRDVAAHGTKGDDIPPTVKFGSFGDTVKLLQQVLNVWPKSNLPLLKVDGSFGPKTHGKVTEFQSRSNLTPDGVVGPLTWAQLEPYIQMIKGIVPIPTDEPAAGARIVTGAEAALGALGWTSTDTYSPLNMKTRTTSSAASTETLPASGSIPIPRRSSIARA